jgi:hypothetical protein
MRVIFDDKVLSERIFDRVRSYLPQKFKGYDVRIHNTFDG